MGRQGNSCVSVTETSMREEAETEDTSGLKKIVVVKAGVKLRWVSFKKRGGGGENNA